MGRLIRMVCCAGCLSLLPGVASPDGKVVPPRDYKGSLEEKAQEAIIIFHGSSERGKATEDLILKINVEGDAKHFAWIVPFPNEPTIDKEDAALFKELFNYVEARNYSTRKSTKLEDGATGAAPEAKANAEPVEVISRQTVGEYDIAVVRENEQGGLNPWLEENGYQKLEDAGDTLTFYREKNYVFACIKVNSEALASQRSVDSHPLRFSFATGGRDGIYFPMKLTGLQSAPFDVNLYVFYRAWLNDKLSQFGYRHRGFQLRYRDWDSPRCEPNGGKAYSLPDEDPFLQSLDHLLPTVTGLFQKLHPGAKYYLTNITASGLKPEDVRAWPDDLWLFPYYIDKTMIPYDARPGGPAHAAYPDVALQEASRSGGVAGAAGTAFPETWIIVLAVVALVGIAGLVMAVKQLRTRRLGGAVQQR
jgi:hypothetical protein